MINSALLGLSSSLENNFKRQKIKSTRRPWNYEKTSLSDSHGYNEETRDASWKFNASSSPISSISLESAISDGDANEDEKLNQTQSIICRLTSLLTSSIGYCGSVTT